MLPLSIRSDKSLDFWSKYKKLYYLLGYCCGRSLWIRVNFTLVVSEKSSLICCGQSTLIHTYPSLGISLGKDCPTPENLESWGQNIGFKNPCWYGLQSSLSLETVLSFLVSQGKKRARDLKLVCGNVGKPLVLQRIDISSYLTKVFWLSASYFCSLVTVSHLQFNCQYQLCQPKQPGPQNHLENTQPFQVFSKSPVREMLLIIKGHWFSKTLVLSALHHMQHPTKVPLPTVGEWFRRDPPHSQNT